MAETLPIGSSKEVDKREQAVEAKNGKVVRNLSELEVLIRARYPLIYVVTWEEQRVLAMVNRIAAGLDKKVFEWSMTMGLTANNGIDGVQKNKDMAT